MWVTHLETGQNKNNKSKQKKKKTGNTNKLNKWFVPKGNGETATYKNGADMWKSLKQGKLLTFTPTELDENTTPMHKDVENQGKQYYQAWGATRSKFGGYVQSGTIHLWPCAEGSSV